MIGNNSAGSHSVRYGMTVDHVLNLDVVLSDASAARLGPLSEAERAGRAAQPTLEGAICRELPLLAGRHAEAIATGFPKFWRQSGGYRLDRLSGRGELDLARFVVGSEGTLVTVVEATVALVPAPAHRAIAVGHFTSSQAAIEATQDALACEPAAVELLDRAILDLARTKIEYRALGSFLSGDPDALLFVTFFGDTEAEAAAGIDRLSALWRQHRHGYHTHRAVTAAEQAAVLKVRQSGLGLLMAAELRVPAAAGVRGGHRGRPGQAGGLRTAVPGDPGAAWPVRRVLRARLGRLPARAPLRGPACAGGHDARGRRGGP